MHCADGQILVHLDFNTLESKTGLSHTVVLPEQKEIVLSAGSYDYSIQLEKDYLALYSANTRFEQLLSDDRAVSVLKEYVPGIFSQLDQKNMESMSKCLNDFRTEALFFGQPTKNIDAAIEALCQIRA